MNQLGFLIVLFAFACFSAGCKKSNDVLLPEEKMAKIIVDLNLSDQIVKKYRPEYRDSISDLLTQSLLRIHDVSKEQLDTNLYLYQFDLERAKSLSGLVLKHLETLKE